MRCTGILLAGLLCLGIAFISGCQKAERLPQPELPLLEETITDALETTGLEWRIERRDEYMIETAEETIPRTIYSLYMPDNSADYTTVFIDSLDSTDFGRKIEVSRYINSEQLAKIRETRDVCWEDCREILELAAQLYGGFESAEEIYQACAATEFPEGERVLWEGALSGGYCRVEARSVSQSTRHKASVNLLVQIYESADAFYRMQQYSEQVAASFGTSP